MAYSNTENVQAMWDGAAQEIASPFKTLSRKLFPKTVEEVLYWAQELWMHQGLYSQAIQKAVRYFMTDLEIAGEDVEYETRRNYMKTLKDNFDVLGEAASVGDDFVAFGNSFSSVHVPFVRFLVCKCGFKAPIRQMLEEGYASWKGGTFSGRCPSCRSQVQYTHQDFVKESGKRGKPVVTRWPPQFIEMNAHPISQRTLYRLRINEYRELADPIRNGDILFLEDTPWDIIDAVTNNKNFTFNEDRLYHMRNRSVAYMQPALKGWGLPKFMSEFETAVLVLLLDKFNEAIITDYLVPFRLLTPPSTNDVQTDPMLNIGMGQFTAKVMGMIKKHRRNPTDWNMLPFPLQYQVLGGEAKDLAPVEIMEHFEVRLLASMSIPEEFYQPSMRGNAGPIIGFKMFERFWGHFGTELNSWIDWLGEQQGAMESWEEVKTGLIPVSVYEDPERIAAKGALAAAGEISKTTYFRDLGLDWRYEQRRKLEEQEEMEEMYTEADEKARNTVPNLEATRVPAPGEEMLMAEEMQQAGGMPGMEGGMPPAAAGGMPPMGLGGGEGAGDRNVTLQEMEAQAEQIASQLMVTPASQRKSQLIELKKTNESLHAFVTQKLNEMEQQAKQQGLQMARQQQMPPPQ